MERSRKNNSGGKSPASSSHKPFVNKGGSENAFIVAQSSEKERLVEVLKKIDSMILKAREMGFHYAADNLEFWRQHRGQKDKTKTMSAAAFRNQPFIIEWLRGKPRRKFIQGAEKRIRSGELKSGQIVSMKWTDSLMAPTDNELYYALGGFTIISDVRARARKLPDSEGGIWLVTFIKWVCRMEDDFNWDKLKTTHIPLYGTIRDDDMRLLEAQGYGTSFKVVSKPWIVNDPELLLKFSPNP